MNTGKIVLGILGGIATGVVTGLLFAPKKGMETRNKISKSSEDLADDLKNKFNVFFDSLTGKAKAVKNKTENKVKNKR